MIMLRKRHKAIIDGFQKLLRSGNDFSVDYIYAMAGEIAYMSGHSARRIVNEYYKNIVTDDMIEFVTQLNCSHVIKVDLFSKEFNVCKRESRLIIRYIKRRKK